MVVAKEKLNGKSIQFQESDSMLDIAKKNKMTPQEVYLIIKDKNLKESSSKKVKNLGRKTLKVLADMDKIDLVEAMKWIKKSGYTNVTPNSKMRTIANELDSEPYDVYLKIKR